MIKPISILQSVSVRSALIACMLLSGELPAAADDIDDMLLSGELPLTPPPDTLTDPQERATYLLAHWWDKMAWHETRLVDDSVFVEQNFSNFIYLLPHAGESGAAAAMRRLVDGAATDSAAWTRVWGVADKYLHNPNSPMRSDTLYCLFLKSVEEKAGDGGADLSAYATRSAFLLRHIRMNRPGAQCGELTFETPAGARTTLRTFIGQEPEAAVAVMFWDADCENCDKVIGQMGQPHDGGQGQPAESGIRHIALCIDGSHAQWEEKRKLFPEYWEHGWAAPWIDGEDTYYVHGLPTFYLIDGDGRVIRKDAGLEDIIGN